MSNAAAAKDTPPSPFAEEPRSPAAASLPNPFTREMAPRPVQVTPINSQLHVRRTGIVPLQIGASRIVKGRDNTKRQFTAQERIHAEAQAERDGRELSLSVICFECRKPYASVDEMVKDHPTAAEMKEMNEAHTWAYWCEDNSDAQGLEKTEALKTEHAALQRAHKSCIEGIGKLSDVEKIMSERKRAEDILVHVTETEKKRLKIAESIIGLLSDTPPVA